MPAQHFTSHPRMQRPPVLLAFVISLLLAGCGAGLPTVGSQFEPRPAPPPRTGPHAAMLPDALQPEISFVPGPASPLSCGDALPAALPALTGFRSAPDSVEGVLCLYGFDFPRPRHPLAVTITGPDGSLLGRDDFHVLDLGTGYFDVIGQTTRDDDSLLPDGEAVRVNGTGVIALRLWLPPDAPAGEWSAEAADRERRAEGTFRIDPPTGPLVSLRPAAEPYNPLFDRRCTAYAPGDALLVAGSGFPPGEPLALGLYYLVDFDGESDQRTAALVYGDLIPAVESGGFDLPYPIPADAQPGFYYALVREAAGGGSPVLSPACFEVREAVEDEVY